MDRVAAVSAALKEVARPVTASIFATCLAFAPLLFLPGLMGRFMFVTPLAVMLTLLVQSGGLVVDIAAPCRGLGRQADEAAGATALRGVCGGITARACSGTCAIRAGVRLVHQPCFCLPAHRWRWNG
jgi:hypothetical protein